MKNIACELKDKKENKKRTRHILANSGLIMESGEVRDLDALYVMNTSGKLLKISELKKDNQDDSYIVKAMADHETEVLKQFGGAKVWLESDGLHARIYFGENTLADHLWGISEYASYSTGIDWYNDGYYGAGLEIDEPIGILREISVVQIGNDPRAKTIDNKLDDKDNENMAKTGLEPAEKDQKGQAVDNTVLDEKNESRASSDVVSIKTRKDDMSKEVKQDELTVDERTALLEKAIADLTDTVNSFTADVPEDETEPTEAPRGGEADIKGEQDEIKEEEETKTVDALKNPVVIIQDKQKEVRQDMKEIKRDWLYSNEAKKVFADTLKEHGHMGAGFDNAWRGEVKKHTNDGIAGLPLPVNVEEMFEVALEKSDGIISHFRDLGGKSFRVNILSAIDEDAGRAAGFVKGDTKTNQELEDTYRDILNIMVYKKLDLDAMEIYENPALIDIRVEELINAIILEIERAAIIGDGRTAPEEGKADRRMFRDPRGFYSVKADAAAESGIGTMLASTVAGSDGANLYEKLNIARGLLRTEGRLIVIAKSSVITALKNAKSGDSYLMTPGSRVEELLDVERVYTPLWMESDAENDAYVLVDGAYILTGERNISTRSDFDTEKNVDVLLAETPRGGSLYGFKSAVALAANN